MALTPKKLAEYQALGRNPELHHLVMCKRVLAETERYLDDLARSVRECKRVDEASRFARWLVFSGVLEIVKGAPQTALAASQTYQKASNLQMDCGDLFRGGKANAKYAESDIAEINAKLDLLMRFLPAETVIDATPATALLNESKPVQTNSVAPGSEANC